MKNFGIIASKIYFPEKILSKDDLLNKTKKSKNKLEKMWNNGFPYLPVFSENENIANEIENLIEKLVKNSDAEKTDKILVLSLCTNEHNKTKLNCYADNLSENFKASFTNLSLVSAHATCYGTISLIQSTEYYIKNNIYDYCIIITVSDEARYLDENTELAKIHYCDGISGILLGNSKTNKIRTYKEYTKSYYYKLWQKPFEAIDGVNWVKNIENDEGGYFIKVINDLCNNEKCKPENINYILPPFIAPKSNEKIFNTLNLDKEKLQIKTNIFPFGILSGIGPFNEFNEKFSSNEFSNMKVIILSFGGWFTWNGLLIEFN